MQGYAARRLSYPHLRDLRYRLRIVRGFSSGPSSSSSFAASRRRVNPIGTGPEGKATGIRLKLLR